MNAPRCPHAASGCNGPTEGECIGLCMPARLDAVIRRDLPSGPVYFTASGGCPRWVNRLRFAERFTQRGAQRIADALRRMDIADATVERVQP